MLIKVGCTMTYDLPQSTPMIAILNVHSSRVSDLLWPDGLVTSPRVEVRGYHDSFGNWCNRLVAPPGRFTLQTNTLVRDHGGWDIADPSVAPVPIEEIPDDVLMYLLGSRYCETDRLAEVAWERFGNTPIGWDRVRAIVDFVHGHIKFGYEFSSPTLSAAEVYTERRGVCRDYAHLAITFCRCLNIPARYCTGYVSDIGLPMPHAPGDFAAWMQVYLGGRWHMLDPRNNDPRIGRILIAYGRDAADVPLTVTFGPNTLVDFKVVTEEAEEPAGSQA